MDSRKVVHTVKSNTVGPYNSKLKKKNTFSDITLVERGVHVLNESLDRKAKGKTRDELERNRRKNNSQNDVLITVETMPMSDVDRSIELPSTSAVNDSEECVDDLEENVNIASNEQENIFHTNILFQKYFRIIEHKNNTKQNISTICLTCEKSSNVPVIVRGSLFTTSNFIRHLRVCTSITDAIDIGF